MQSETEALIEQDLDAQSFKKRRSLLTDRLDASISFTRGALPRSCSNESVRSLRRASSLDDIDGMRAEWNSRPGDTQTHSSEYVRGSFQIFQILQKQYSLKSFLITAILNLTTHPKFYWVNWENNIVTRVHRNYYFFK